jgi:hypothetical protein
VTAAGPLVTVLTCFGEGFSTAGNAPPAAVVFVRKFSDQGGALVVNLVVYNWQRFRVEASSSRGRQRSLKLCVRPGDGSIIVGYDLCETTMVDLDQRASYMMYRGEGDDIISTVLKSNKCATRETT